MAKKKKEMDKLAWENAQALACHMSYGKWKAMQEPVLPVKKDELPEGWKKCEWCGTPYKPWSKRPQKYCQSYCQNSASRERLKAKKDGKQTESVPSEATGEATAML